MLVKYHLDELEKRINSFNARIDEDNNFVDDESLQDLYDRIFQFNTDTVYFEIDNYSWDESSEEDNKYFLLQMKRLETLELLISKVIRVRYQHCGKEFDWLYDETEKVEDE